MQLYVMSCSVICAHVTYCIVTQYRQCNVCDAMKGEGVKLTLCLSCLLWVCRNVSVQLSAHLCSHSSVYVGLVGLCPVASTSRSVVPVHVASRRPMSLHGISWRVNVAPRRVVPRHAFSPCRAAQVFVCFRARRARVRALIGVSHGL